MQEQFRSRLIGVLINVIDARSIESARTADDSVNLVAFRKQQLGKVGTILSGDAGDECAFHAFGPFQIAQGDSPERGSGPAPPVRRSFCINDNTAGAARNGKGTEEPSDTRRGERELVRPHLSPQCRSMVNSKGVVGVAQLVERRSVAPNVAGSSPVSHPNFFAKSTSQLNTISLPIKISHTPHRMSAHEIVELSCAAVRYGWSIGGFNGGGRTCMDCLGAEAWARPRNGREDSARAAQHHHHQ